MRISKKQKSEIDFLIKYFHVKPTDKEIDEYLAWTVYGRKPGDSRRTANVIFQAKRRLDMTVKMWIEDIKLGLLFHKELLDYFDNDVYATKMLNSIFKKLNPKELI